MVCGCLLGLFYKGTALSLINSKILALELFLYLTYIFYQIFFKKSSKRFRRLNLIYQLIILATITKELSGTPFLNFL